MVKILVAACRRVCKYEGDERLVDVLAACIREFNHIGSDWDTTLGPLIPKYEVQQDLWMDSIAEFEQQLEDLHNDSSNCI
jgi:hypothetical protein